MSVPGGVVNCVVAGGEKAPPIVMLHGGPGAGHRQLEPVFAMTAPRRTFTFDQLGCGLSDRPGEPDLWTVERAVEELRIVLDETRVEDYHLLGHSWGATLALAALAENRIRQPRSLIMSSPLVSSRAWEADTLELVKPIYADLAAKGLSGPRAMERALAEFNERHWCRSPEIRSLMISRRDEFGEHVYRTMWGSSELRCEGRLRDLDLTPSLPSLEMPVLVTRGEHDMVLEATARTFVRAIPQGSLVTIPGAAHLPFWESPKAYQAALHEFLSRVE